MRRDRRQPTGDVRERQIGNIGARLVGLVRPFDYRRVDECLRVIDWLDPRPGDRLLDVGCGDGFYDRQMARRGARVDAIDASRHRLARASRWHPHPNVTYQRMAADALAFEDQRFDKVVSICVLEHIENDVRALSEMCRVIRPGGRLVLSCDSLSNAGISERLRRRHAQRYAVRRFYSRESLYDRLQAAGFVPLRSSFILSTPVSLALARLTYLADDVGRIRAGWVVKYPVLAVAGTLGLPISRLSERLGARSHEGLTLVVEAVRPT